MRPGKLSHCSHVFFSWMKLLYINFSAHRPPLSSSKCKHPTRRDSSSTYKAQFVGRALAVLIRCFKTAKHPHSQVLLVQIILFLKNIPAQLQPIIFCSSGVREFCVLSEGSAVECSNQHKAQSCACSWVISNISVFW